MRRFVTDALRKSERKLYRWSPLEIQLLEEASRISGKNVTDLVREPALKLCQQIILDDELRSP